MHQKLDLPWFRTYATSHLEHHIATNADFTLKQAPNEQVCFEAVSLLPLTVFNCILFGLLFHKRVKWYVIVVVNVMMSLYAALAWNTFHTFIHSIDLNICRIGGLSKEHVHLSNPYVHWAIKNHQAHHHFKGSEKGNYNVVFPGADFAFGTHKVMPAPTPANAEAAKEPAKAEAAVQGG
jgi:hypothetical protein